MQEQYTMEQPGAFEELYEQMIQKIREVRKKEKKFNQQEMADILGVSQVAYSDMESGKTKFSVINLFKTLQHLEIDILSKNGENPGQKEELMLSISNVQDFFNAFVKQNDKISYLENKLDKIEKQNDEIKLLLQALVQQQLPPGRE